MCCCLWGHTRSAWGAIQCRGWKSGFSHVNHVSKPVEPWLHLNLLLLAEGERDGEGGSQTSFPLAQTPLGGQSRNGGPIAGHRDPELLSCVVRRMCCCRWDCTYWRWMDSSSVKPATMCCAATAASGTCQAHTLHPFFTIRLCLLRDCAPQGRLQPLPLLCLQDNIGHDTCVLPPLWEPDPEEGVCDHWH